MISAEKHMNAVKKIKNSIKYLLLLKEFVWRFHFETRL